MSTDLPQDAIVRGVAAILPDIRPAAITPVARRGAVHPDVWRVTLADGRRLVAKHQAFAPLAAGTPYDLLVTESAVSRALLDRSAPVVRVLGVYPEASLAFYVDAGRLTLSDAVQSASAVQRASLSNRLVDAFHVFQSAFAHATPELSGHVFPDCDADGLRASWEKATGTLTEDTLSPILPVSAQTLARVHELAAGLAERPVALGPTDYNARNIVLDDRGRLTFIDLAKVGYDWPARRLLQYATSLGERPLCLIDAVSAARYAAIDVPDVATASLCADLDAHHLILHLHLAARFAASPVAVSRHASRIRSAISTPLSDDANLVRLRGALSG